MRQRASEREITHTLLEWHSSTKSWWRCCSKEVGKRCRWYEFVERFADNLDFPTSIGKNVEARVRADPLDNLQRESCDNRRVSRLGLLDERLVRSCVHLEASGVAGNQVRSLEERFGNVVVSRDRQRTHYQAINVDLQIDDAVEPRGRRGSGHDARRKALVGLQLPPVLGAQQYM